MYTIILTTQESGTVVLSMDALFGLPRKKSSGISYRDAIHGHYFFYEQSMVDEFVLSASLRKAKDVKVSSSLTIMWISLIFQVNGGK